MSLVDEVRATWGDTFPCVGDRELLDKIAALEARCAALTGRLRELAIEGHQGGWGDHIKHDFATCPEPSCVADRALSGEGT